MQSADVGQDSDHDSYNQRTLFIITGDFLS